jgi:hypothetical protein
MLVFISTWWFRLLVVSATGTGAPSNHRYGQTPRHEGPSEVNHFIPMNEQNPGAMPGESAPVPMAYEDRSAGLLIFGILTLLLGCLAGLFFLFALVGLAMSANGVGTPVPMSAILPAVLIYGMLAVALVWLGVGSIMARRWARALLLIFSWSWLVMGLYIMVFTALVMPKRLLNLSSNGTADHSAVPSVATAGLVVGMLLFSGFFFLIFPAVWTVFYQSRHVKDTCERRDPVTRWTDACPLPVLGYCLWLVISAPMLLIMPLVNRGVMPFFGTFLTGVPGTLFCLAVACIWSYAAWLLYKLDRRGWWLVLIALCLFIVSALLTFARHDELEMYRLMGYPKARIALMQESGALAGKRAGWLTAVYVLPFLGYLLYIRKFFLRKS